MEKKKVGFASGIGFILAAAGSAVGLGNLWGFPYKTSQNGGAAFVLIYIACVLLIGFVTMLSEIYLGRRSQANPMTAYKMVNKNLGWCGLVAIMIPAFIICYYSVLGGWTTKYALNSFSGNAGIVSTFSVNTGEVILYTALFLVLSVTIIMGGVKDGIEKASKVLMPVLFLILVAIAIYALTLGRGVREGLAFYLKPDFSGITFKSVLVAMGQAFYSLSLGMGIMITYGSYLDKKQDLGKSTMIIVGMDTVVALMAGLCVIPGRFALDPNGALGGPELLFITMQNVFDKMGPAGPVFGILFYLLVFFAAISSSISMLEVIVAHFCDKAREKGKGDRRKLYSAIAVVICAALCALVCADGMGSNHISPAELLGLAGAKLPGWSTSWLGLFDSVAEGLLMPLGALLMCLMISWELKPDALRQEILLNGENRPWVYDFFRLCVKYITPLCMLMILYGQISDFFIV